MDLYLDWNSDLILTPSGDLQTAVGWDQVRQRIVRKMLTNSYEQLPDGTWTAADNVFAPSFGLGLGSLVLQLFSQRKTKDSNTVQFEQKVNAAVLSEPSPVDPGIPPAISFSRPDPRTMEIFITVYLNSGKQGQISISQFQ